MKKQTIKLNESQLRKIVKETVKKVLRENIEDSTEYGEETYREYLKAVPEDCRMLNPFIDWVDNERHIITPPEYVIDTFINGNKTEAYKYFMGLSESDRREVYRIAKQYRIYENLINIFNEIERQREREWNS